MRNTRWPTPHPVLWMVTLVLATVLIGCQDGSDEPPEALELPELPANPGYLRAAHPNGGELIIFDADTFKIYRSVELPPSGVSYSHRLEIDPAGRIWIGFSQAGKDQTPGHVDRVLVFSPDGDLEHELDLGCSGPDAGVAFANGYAFVGCAGFTWSRVVVIDLNTMEAVKAFGGILPPHPDAQKRGFYITAVEEVAGSILVLGYGSPPRDYQPSTLQYATTTGVGVIDPETLTFRGFQTGFRPGIRVLSALEVDGKAWLFNALSHLAERLPRTDVYVMDPQTLEIVDRFNLGQPFPTWAEKAEDGTIYISNMVPLENWWAVGYRSGITWLDPTTRVETFVPTPDFGRIRGMGVYRGRLCLAGTPIEFIEITPQADANAHVARKQAEEARKRARASGLWRLTDEGEMELNIPHQSAVGVAFVEPKPGG